MTRGPRTSGPRARAQTTAFCIAIALLAGVTAGCIGTPGTNTDPSNTLRPGPQGDTAATESPAAARSGPVAEPDDVLRTFSHDNCEEHFGFFLHPPSMWQHALPQGFDLGRDPTGQFAIYALLAPSCIAGSGATFGELWEVLIVVPPTDLAMEEGPNALLLGLTTSDSVLAATWSAWGFPAVQTGAIHMETTVVQDNRLGTVTLSGAPHDIVLHTATHGEGAPHTGPGRIFVPNGAGGLAAIWDFTVETEAQYATGESLLEASRGFSPLPGPAQPGLAMHRTGETITFTYVPVTEWEDAFTYDGSVDYRCMLGDTSDPGPQGCSGAWFSMWTHGEKNQYLTTPTDKTLRLTLHWTGTSLPQPGLHVKVETCVPASADRCKPLSEHIGPSPLSFQLHDLDLDQLLRFYVYPAETAPGYRHGSSSFRLEGQVPAEGGAE